MKRSVHILICLLLALGCWPSASWGQGTPVLDEANAFITRWTGEAGKPIKVPLYGNYAYSWEKADGTVIKAEVANVAEQGLLELPVSENGEYVLKAGPAGVKRMEYGINQGNYYDGSRGTPGALLQVVQWGSVAWESFAGAFYRCENMNIAEGAGRPNLSGVESMQSAFEQCSKFNSPIGDWDVSNVANMLGMFCNCTVFNQPLEQWDVSKVTDMGVMFYECRAFNRPLGEWNVSNVKNMALMFYGCESFNQPLGGWTLSALEHIQGLVHDLGLVLSGLSVENYSATLAGWAAKKVQLKTGICVDASGLFFNEDGKAARDQLVADREWVFTGDDLVVPIEPLDPAHSFVTRWQGKAGDTIRVPLYGQYSYEWVGADGVVVGSGEVRVGARGEFAFLVPADGVYDLKTGPAGVKRIEYGINQGSYHGSHGTPGALLQVVQWGSVAWESFAGAFYGCVNMNIGEGAGRPDLSGVESMSSAFCRCKSFNSPIGDWDVSKVTNMRDMFEDCTSFNQPLETWDVSNVTDMSSMFFECIAFSQPLEGWNVSQVTRMDWMFKGCRAFNQSLENWDVSKVTNMLVMFADCSTFNQPLEKWDVSNVTNMGDMFYGCRAFNQPLETWDVSNVTNMGAMFARCSSFNQPLEKWDVSKVTYMGHMFYGCRAFNQPLETWDVSNVTNMRAMFDGCSMFNRPLGGWTLSALARNQSESHDLLVPSGLSVENYSATLVGWVAKKDQLTTGIRVDAKGLYFDERGKTAQQQLKDDKGWVFEGDSEATVSTPAVDIVDAPSQLYVGDTYTFKARVVPAEASQEVTWLVKEGDEWGTFLGNVLTVKKTGWITVIATSVAVPASSRSVKVRVSDFVSLTGITVSPATAQLKIDGTQQLTVGYTPADASNKSVTWSSSDENVATVSAEGGITGKKAGTATITAISVDGGHKASCTVTVVASTVLTGIMVSPTTADLKVGSTQQLTVSYMPVNATNRSVTWSSSDEGVALVDAKGVVTAKKAGTATITATSVDGGHRGTCTVTVVADDKPSGVESALLMGVTVSPNPFDARLIVRGTEAVVRYTLVNASGAEVLRGAHDGASELCLETGRLAAGVYWLRLEAADGERVVQVVRR